MERLGIDIWNWRHIVRRFTWSDATLLIALLAKRPFVVCPPSALILQVLLPLVVKLAIAYQLAALELLPGTGRIGLRDRPVDVTEWYAFCTLVVKNSLERRDDL